MSMMMVVSFMFASLREYFPYSEAQPLLLTDFQKHLFHYKYYFETNLF